MAKRIAEKELTDRNWDQEDEAEEVGTFSVASEEVLKNRAIKKAKRRNVGSESDSGGAFKGFKGLVVPSGGGGFSGFGSGPGGKPLEGLSNGNSTSAPPFTGARAAAEPKATFGSFAANGPTALVDKKISDPKTNGSSPQPSSSSLASSTACAGSTYHKQLAALNCSVRDWIVKHVNTNPLCDLTPIFKDYEKYLATIEQQHDNSGSGNSESGMSQMSVDTQTPSLFGSAKLSQESTFLFHGNKTEDTSEKKMEVVSEKKTDIAPEAASVSFNFGKKIDSSVLGSLSSGPSAGFSFSPGNSSLFSKDITQSKPVSSPLEGQAEGGSNECKGEDEEESDEPPKVVVTEVKEEDAFYSTKYDMTLGAGLGVPGLWVSLSSSRPELTLGISELERGEPLACYFKQARSGDFLLSTCVHALETDFFPCPFSSFSPFSFHREESWFGFASAPYLEASLTPSWRPGLSGFSYRQELGTVTRHPFC
ncbi:nucleoporin 50 [Ictidomys tridecemlineatus]|nr:nucleoporin 50 [Ictidomys tridecemlineatus]